MHSLSQGNKVAANAVYQGVSIDRLGLAGPQPAKHVTRPTPTLFRLLVWHFWGRFFDKESLSPQGEPEANVTQTLGVLAVPSAFFVLLFRPLTLVGWDLVAVRFLFVSYSMIVMGLIMVLEWDALFPDRRDYQILTPLPLRLPTVFLAKITALGLFLGVFLLDINFFGVVFWPGIDGGRGLISIMLAHVVAVVTAGLFAAVSIAALQGVLINLLSPRVFRRVSVALQTMLVSLLVLLLFITPLVGFGTRRLVAMNSAFVRYYPGYWFVGFYERLRPATGNAGLLELGRTAIFALMIAVTVFLVTFLPMYQRQARKILEMPAPSPKGAGFARRVFNGMMHRIVLRHPVERAVFHFINQTITRSVKHRLFLATYGGFGAALAIMSVAEDRSGLLRLPLTLSFILVSGLRAAFNFPSELRANWLYQISESDDIQPYLQAMRKWIVACAIVPLFLLMAPMEFACFRPLAALFHLAFGIALSVLLMDIMFFGFRKVPFTCAYFPGKVNLVGLGLIYIFGFTLYSRTMAAVEGWLTHFPLAATGFFVIVAVAHFGVVHWRRRYSEDICSLSYEDEGDPVVRTLDLAAR